MNETAYLSAVMRDVQTEAFQGCQAHNSFVCYAIETSCSLLSQYLLPNGMCALLLALINNTRLKEGLITSPLCLSTPHDHPLSLFVLPSLSFIVLSPPSHLLLPFLPLALSEFCYSLFLLTLPSPVLSVTYHILHLHLPLA